MATSVQRATSWQSRFAQVRMAVGAVPTPPVLGAAATDFDHAFAKNAQAAQLLAAMDSRGGLSTCAIGDVQGARLLERFVDRGVERFAEHIRTMATRAREATHEELVDLLDAELLRHRGSLSVAFEIDLKGVLDGSHARALRRAAVSAIADLLGATESPSAEAAAARLVAADAFLARAVANVAPHAGDKPGPREQRIAMLLDALRAERLRSARERS